MVKVSIIVPIYNAALFISRCFSSLLEQTLQEIEILAIDDRGFDNGIDMVQQFQQTHPRGACIQIYTLPQNSGAWAARNFGLQHAKGEYVGFVDADDACELTMFEQLYCKAILHRADWCYCNAVKHFKNGKIVSVKQANIPQGLYSRQNKKDAFTNHIAFFTTGIYRLEHLREHQIMFPDSKFSEDSYFVWIVVSTCERVACVDKVMYHYYINEQSVSLKPDATKAMQKVGVFKKLRDRLKEVENYNAFKEEIDFLCIKKGYLIPILIELINNKELDIKIIKSILKQLDSEIVNYASNHYLKKNYKLLLLLYLIKYHTKFLSKGLRCVYNNDPF